ncbi:MAG: GNAT family N-acetyltransferase [Deltaproteobacteria bacterium]|nr:GNAT family N-acetyltransferase [Deltaproteobacteria bacterium]
MPFRESIRQIAKKMQSCEEWLELVRDLQEPIQTGGLQAELHLRWADKGDLMAINALQGFVKETDFMEASLRKGDRCLVVEHEERICAFAWVTFSDFSLALWYTLKLPPGWSYLVYIFVHPRFAGRGMGSALLGSLMKAVRDQGGSHMIAGMYSNWHASFRMHTKLGFRVHRRLSQCRLLNIFPTPPKAV